MSTAEDRNAERLARKKEREGKDLKIKLALGLVGLLVILWFTFSPAVVSEDASAGQVEALTLEIERTQGLLESETYAETRAELEMQLERSREALRLLGEE